MKRVVLLAAALLLSSTTAFGTGVWVEAESFRDKGGWSVDQQFMDLMGSPYLIAHGMGKPVADAVTTARAPGDSPSGWGNGRCPRCWETGAGSGCGSMPDGSLSGRGRSKFR